MMTAFAAGACGARYECAGPVCDPDPALAWLGHPALDVRLWCEVGVYSPDYLHFFIKRIGAAAFVVKMVASDLLMYYFVRFC